MLTFAVILNIVLTAACLYLVWVIRGIASKILAPTVDQPLVAPKPIHHPKVTGPTTSEAMRGVGYWRPKDDPKAEPFLAAHYEKDTTGNDADFPAIPADTYLDLMGRRFPGAKFRSLYVPAEEIVVVSKFKPRNPLRQNSLVTAKATSAISDEDEQKLADEYELGTVVPPDA